MQLSAAKRVLGGVVDLHRSRNDFGSQMTSFLLEMYGNIV